MELQYASQFAISSWSYSMLVSLRSVIRMTKISRRVDGEEGLRVDRPPASRGAERAAAVRATVGRSPYCGDHG